MKFVTAAHFSGVSTQRLDLTIQLPWVYIIVALEEKLIYIGETYDESGLIVRLSSHFGRPINSSLRQAALKHLGIIHLKAPFLVVAAKLPYGEDEVSLSATSKKIRLLYEAVLHQFIIEKFAAPSGWTLISSFNSTGESEPKEIKIACDSIYNCFLSAVSFIEPLSSHSPFHLILLDTKKKDKEETQNVGMLIERTELCLFSWVIDLLKQEYSDDWWVRGIPLPIRKQCQNRKEEEGISKIPAEAYLTLIDFRDIAKNNWKLCASTMESISGQQGKDKSTSWIVQLNETRKLWAHPIKQKYFPIKTSDIIEVKAICKKITELL